MKKATLIEIEVGSFWFTSPSKASILEAGFRQGIISKFMLY